MRTYMRNVYVGIKIWGEVGKEKEGAAITQLWKI